MKIENEGTSGTSIPTTKSCIPENLKHKLRKCLEIERNIREQQNERIKNGRKRLNRKESERRREERKKRRKKGRRKE